MAGLPSLDLRLAPRVQFLACCEIETFCKVFTPKGELVQLLAFVLGYPTTKESLSTIIGCNN